MHATNKSTTVRSENAYATLNARLQKAHLAGAAYRRGRRGTVVRPGPSSPGTGDTSTVLPFRPR